MQSAIKIIMMQKRGDFIAVEWETKAQPSEVIKRRVDVAETL